MVVVSASTGGAGKARDAKRAKALAEKKRQMEQRIHEQVDSWFSKFDTDGDHLLQKEELRSLLSHVHPHQPADDAALDNLMQMVGAASGVLPPGGSITKDKCMKVRPASSPRTRTCPAHASAFALQAVQKYNTYLKERVHLDELFAQFDKDGAAEALPGKPCLRKRGATPRERRADPVALMCRFGHA